MCIYKENIILVFGSEELNLLSVYSDECDDQVLGGDFFLPLRHTYTTTRNLPVVCQHHVLEVDRTYVCYDRVSHIRCMTHVFPSIALRQRRISAISVVYL